MAEPHYSAASWVHVTTGTETQSSELSAPPLSAHGPFQQQIPSMYALPYMSMNDPSMPQIHDVSNVPTSNQLHGRSPYPPLVHQQHSHPHGYPYQFPRPPRLPPAFRNDYDSVHQNMGFYDTGDRMQGYQPFIPPRAPSYNHTVPGQFNAGPPQYSRRRYNHRMTMGTVVRDSLVEGVRGTQQENQDPPPENRAPPQRENRQPDDPTITVQSLHPWVPSEAPSHRSDRNVSGRTSNNRRDFARYSVDLSHSSTSSDAEEAAARAPPLSRMRHRPRAPDARPPRFAGRPYFDPNNATPGQIQGLKDSLQRRLPSELPEEASDACDICQKDYSTKHVAPTEEQENATVLSCGHSFGEFCIFQWVSFPYCRTIRDTC
jgi:hypothetical protein